MKKAKIIGKKTLSVFLAVLMVLTAWVWVAPTEAEAVTSGSYSYQLIAYVNNDFDSNADGYFTIRGKSDNGTNTSYTTLKNKVAVTEDVFKGSETRGTYVTLGSGTSTSFPYYFDFYSYKTSLIVGIGQLTISLQVKVNGEWKTVCEKLTNAQQGQGEVKASGEADATAYPTPKTIEWVTASENDLIIKDNSNVNRAMTFRVLDQYGVRMSSTALNKLDAVPEVTVSSSQSGTIGTESTEDIYYTFSDTSSTSYSITVTATPDAKSKTYNYQDITIGATCDTLSLTDKTFRLHDPKYTITFDKNADDASDMIPESYDVYYGESLASQATLDGSSTYPTSGSRTGYTFLGMYDAAEGGNLMNVNADVTAAKTYYAHWVILKYAAVFMDRSGDEVVLVESDIPHGSTATKVADATSKLNKVEFDDVNHYVLNESNVWTPSTDSVTGNTFFYPNYVASAHTLDAGTAIEATCQHGAGIEYKCTGCDYSYIDETSTELGAHTKSESYIVDTEATCTTAGSGHYFCTVCGATLDTVTIPAKGHSFKVEVTKDATCKETGTRTYTCTVCDYSEEETIPLAQHNYVAGETVAATCQHSPYTPYSCSVCGDSYNKYEGNATTNHNWDITVSDVTADNTKIVTGTCSVCNATFTKEVELPATHNFTNIAITKQPTCKAEGEITISCADTGCTESYTATLPAVSTAHSEYTTTYTPAATCGAKGSVVTKCKDCGAEIETTEIAALNHSYNYVRVEPTCTTAGSITKTCENCGDVQTETISATGHKTVTVEANCQHGGYEKCGVCNAVISETAKKAHDFTGDVTEVAATCTVDGIKYTKCKKCDAQKAEILAKTGHDTDIEWVEIIPATCLGKGLKTKTCSKCNVVLESQEIAPTGHNHRKDAEKSYGATCTTAGKDVFVCENCGDVNTTVIQPTGHKYVKDGAIVTTPATCETAGYTTYNCDNCDETHVVDIAAAKGHDWTEWSVTKAATNTEPGELSRTCKNGCGKTETAEIPAGGHTITEVYKVRFFDAAGNQIGEDQNVKFGESAVAPAAPEKKADGTYHYEFSSWDRNYGEITSDLDVYPTYEKELHYGGEATCKDKALCDKCGTPYGETDDSKHVIATKIKSATCEESGTITYYCSEGCGKATTVEEIKPMGHDFGEWEIYQAGNCAAPTIKIRKCRNYGCDKHDRWEIVNSHNWHIVKEIPPTCTAVGYSEYKYCLSCGTAVDSVKIPALGHRDNNGDGRCDYCTYVQNEVKCNCMCHSTGFMKFIYSIVRFFWRLTKSTPSCSCGARHY